jgi:hypothetical protein
MCTANKDILRVSLPICILFIPFCCLIALARNSNTILNRSGDSEHQFLIPDFRGNDFSFSPLYMMLAVGFSYIAFIILRYFPSIPNFLRDFIMKWCWILSKAFSTSIEMIKWFLSFLLLMCCITFIDFFYVEPPLYSWDEAYLIVVKEILDVLNLVCHYFIKHFCINVH